MLNRHLPTEEDLRRALRSRICTQCGKRPAGSETAAADQPRPCEAGCTLFRLVPRIHNLVYLDPMVSDLHHAAQKLLCDACAHCPNQVKSGEPSSICPTKRYRKQILQTIEQSIRLGRE